MTGSNERLPDSSAGSPESSEPRHRSFHLTPSRTISLRSLLDLLRADVPFDFRTLALSFFIGSLFSFPIGAVFALTIRPFEPPEWTAPLYFGAVIVSFVVLPFWSHFAFRQQPILRRLGLATFQLALFLFVLGLLFPAL